MLSIETLKNRADFVRLNRGHKFLTDYFILRYAARGEGQTRIGYTVTTKCGNAVIRNRIKRRLRALARELAPELARTSTDYVFIARNDGNVATVPPAQLREAMTRAFAAATR